jgi:GntR family transcriptional regulator / MocR family aminotransferase
MINLATLLTFDKTIPTPVYRQIAEGIIQYIRRGILHPGTRVQATRELAREINLHRKTIVAAYQELLEVGWLEARPKKGFYVCVRLPDATPKKLFDEQRIQSYPSVTGFSLKREELPVLQNLRPTSPTHLVLNDGFPDLRLVPVNELLKEYHSIAKRKSARRFWGYSAKEGSMNLRHELVRHLTETRGLSLGIDNILITKGAQMAIHVAASLLIKPGDHVVVGEPGYFIANLCFQNMGAKLLHIPVDDQGIDVNALEKLCRRKKIRMIYVVPHHHHPTTVTLSPERRLRLLDLAAKYKIAIIEDDYDFDLHYAGSPVLPMASFDRFGSIVYIGTLSKIIAPAIRIGFMVAPENFIRLASQQKFLMDMQSDTLLEEAIAAMYKSGAIDRHIKKSRNAYRERRDFFCQQLADKLGDHVSFRIPEGGMSVWTKFAEVDTQLVSVNAAKSGLLVNDGKRYNTGKTDHRAMRLGFASLNLSELAEAVQILSKAVKKSL